jgi:hypothetical protein
MARSVFALAICCLLSEAARGQTLDKDRLRKAAYLPQDSFICNYNDPDRDGRGKRVAASQAIDDLTQQLRGIPGDAEIHLRLAEIYQYRNDKSAADAALIKAERILLPHLQTNV